MKIKLILYIVIIALTNYSQNYSMSETPTEILHRAVKSGDNGIKLITKALEAGADVNSKNLDGDTPLITLAKKSNIYTVEKAMKILLSHKANINARNNKKLTVAMELFSSANNFFVITPTILDKNRENLLLLLLDLNADINFQDKQGNALLHYAVNNNNLNLVQKILNLQPDFNLKTYYNKTALEIAEAHNKNEAIKQLLHDWPEKLKTTIKKEVEPHLPLVLADIIAEYITSTL
jgi:ankyrin repeat protein